MNRGITFKCVALVVSLFCFSAQAANWYPIVLNGQLMTDYAVPATIYYNSLYDVDSNLWTYSVGEYLFDTAQSWTNSSTNSDTSYAGARPVTQLLSAASIQAVTNLWTNNYYSVSGPSGFAPILATDSGLPSGQSSRYVGAWVKLRSKPAVGSGLYIVAAYGKILTYNSYAMYIDNRQIGTPACSLAVSPNGIGKTGSTTLSTNIWYYLSVDMANVSTVNLYVNGVKETLSQSDNFSPMNTVLTGTNFIGGWGISGIVLDGWIDSVLVLNGSLSSNQIYNIFDKTKYKYGY